MNPELEIITDEEREEMEAALRELNNAEFDLLYANEAANEQDTFPTPDDDLPW